MKKLFITSAVAIAISVPAIADPVTPNIAVGTNPADCNETVLETTSGTANLEANWTANTLHLSWSVDGTPYATNDTNAASCTYDSGITIPTNPSKIGYTFAGWTVKAAAAPTPAAQCSIPSAYLSETTYTFASKSISHNEYCEGMAGYDEENGEEIWYGMAEENADCSDSRFAHLSDGEWSVSFSTGMVKGRALCSSTSGDWATAGTPNQTGGGQYCWCQPTSYIANGSNACSLNVSSSSWVFRTDNCARYCAYDCANGVQDNGDFRAALFGLAQ